MVTLTNGRTWLVNGERSYYTTARTPPSQRRHIAQPTSRLVRTHPNNPTSLHPRSLVLGSKHRSVGLINGRCQKHCQSILCLFGFIWTSVEVGGGGGGEAEGGKGGRGSDRAKGGVAAIG